MIKILLWCSRYYGGVTFYSIQNSIGLTGTCLKIVLCPMYVKTETGAWCPTPCFPISMLLSRIVNFCHTMALTAVSLYRRHCHSGPNPSMKTSFIGLKQSCLCLVWADSSGGVSSIVLPCLVPLFCLFKCCAAITPFHPACVDHQRVPLPSHFPSPLSLLSWHHCCIALALPVLVWHHGPLALASSMLLSYLHQHHCHRCHNTPTSLPSLPTYFPCIRCNHSCRSHQCWCQHCNSQPLASTTLMPMPSSRVLPLPLLPPIAASAIFNRCPTPPPNASGPPPSSNATTTAIFQCHFHPCWLLCAHFIPQNARVYFIGPCDWEFSWQRTVSNGACWQGHWQHHPLFSSIKILLLRWKSGRRGRVQMSWSNSWSADLGCGLCSCKSLGHRIWAIFYPKTPWHYVKKSILYSILRTLNTPKLCSNTPPKMLYLRCDSRGIYVTGTYSRSRNSWKKNCLNGRTNFLQWFSKYHFHKAHHFFFLFFPFVGCKDGGVSLSLVRLVEQ